MVFSVRDFYKTLLKEFKQAGLDTPELDLRFFLKALPGVSDIDIVTDTERVLSEEEQERVRGWAARRLAGTPVSKILGHNEFWGLPFKVTKEVLDPRPDTEILVDAALKGFAGKPPKKILDLGTGSGCILIALLHEWPDAQGTAVDISEKALSVARDNAKMNGVADRIEFVHSDWCEKIDESYGLIVSNPPYIPNPELESLSDEVKNHDPILALDGGIGGMESYKKIFLQIFSLQNGCGKAFVEIGAGQEENVTRLVEESGLSVKRIIPDLAGIPRVVEISCGDK